MKEIKMHFHFIGIGGIGMSGIALILKKQGHTISGCDNNLQQKSIELLKKENCNLYQGDSTKPCSNKSHDALVYSTAVSNNHPERIWARNNAIPEVHRSEALAKIMQEKISIAIAGSHGKTTTSSLLSHIFIKAQTDPTVIIGGHLHSINSNAQYGKGKMVIVEADESDRSLLNLFPTYAVITNIDLEHLETYKNLNDIIQTFKTFLSHISENGSIIINGDDKNIQKIIEDKNIISFGESKNTDFRIVKVTLEPEKSSFFLKYKNKTIGPITVSLPGIHNIFNATAAFISAYTQGLNTNIIIEALSTFTGVDRRFTFKGTYNGANIFDDYGHHPLEIKHTLAIARKQTQNKLTVLFQPHRYTRTAHLWDDFIKTFLEGNIDTLIITDIYEASEQPIKNISSLKLVEALKKMNPNFKVNYIPYEENFNSLTLYLKDKLLPGDTLLLQGAGKMNLIKDKLI
jgi:UDP-N-acetylmuramate--alanine ligase